MQRGHIRAERAGDRVALRALRRVLVRAKGEERVCDVGGLAVGLARIVGADLNLEGENAGSV